MVQGLNDRGEFVPIEHGESEKEIIKKLHPELIQKISEIIQDELLAPESNKIVLEIIGENLGL
jgi:hypothetical protein